ncbi:MAG TPA: hypothetical protein VJ279_08255 [Hanamia sp.]|jgi:hypothetical protein|nr:hypothetical protein [Hanamia sp.]
MFSTKILELQEQLKVYKLAIGYLLNKFCKNQTISFDAKDFLKEIQAKENDGVCLACYQGSMFVRSYDNEEQKKLTDISYENFKKEVDKKLAQQEKDDETQDAEFDDLANAIKGLFKALKQSKH